MFEKQKLQVKIEQNQRLNVYSSPWSFFSLFFTDEIVNHITFQTNLYNNEISHARGTKPVSPVSREEIKKLFGIILFMGIEKFPNRRMYWNPVTLSKVISESNLTRNRFDELLRVLHFNNNAFQRNPGEVGCKWLFKLQPIIDHFRQVFSTLVTPETMLVVDEMMIAFKGRHKLKVYMPAKPIKWGYKIWFLAGVSGYVYNFEIVGEHDKKGAPAGEKSVNGIGESGYVVARLTQSLDRGKHKVFFDNYFASPDLLAYLKEKGIFALSTLRPNRSRICPIMNEKDMKQKDRGATDEIADLVNGVVICT